jgi:CRISPR-associated protein Cmr1
MVRDERTYRFLTPVFGGGVHVDGQKKPHDEVTPVRVPSIRGQLRFWWRACNPRGCRTTKELLEAEGAVFGSTTEPSPLGIAVARRPDPARDVAVLRDKFGVVDERHGRAYGAFPLRDTNQGVDHGVLHDHPGEWTIAVTYPAALEADVEAAFWAWAHFGGLGGRVRRGFGAIEEVRRGRGALADIEAGWSHVKGLEVPWPHLQAKTDRRLRTKSGSWKNGADAQEFLLGIMRRLRQVDIGRKSLPDDTPGKHPGRSYWPEPDAIRKLTGARSRDHAMPVTGIDAFPRAVFGMPIIFHFKDRSDPQDVTLLPQVNGETQGRLASALIVRPHRAANGSVEALALVLAHPQPGGLVLVDKNKRTFAVKKWKLTATEAQHLGLGGRPSPLVKGGTVFADPIDRFLEEIR